MTRIAHADKALNINEVARHEPRPACLTAGHALRARHHAPRGRRFYSNEVYAYDGPKHGIIFCGKGRLTKITDGSGNTEFKYDLQGRLIQKKQTTGTIIKTVSYAYDSFGRMNSITYPSGKVLTYGFDGQGRINSMALNGVNLVSAITYQPFGPAKSWLWSGGPLQTRLYDLDGRQASYPYTATGTVALTYDLGNRIKNLSGTVAKAYGYDKLDRLATYSNEVYAYDATGNRTSHTVGATAYSYTYPTTSKRSPYGMK